MIPSFRYELSRAYVNSPKPSLIVNLCKTMEKAAALCALLTLHTLYIKSNKLFYSFFNIFINNYLAKVFIIC